MLIYGVEPILLLLRCHNIITQSKSKFDKNQNHNPEFYQNVQKVKSDKQLLYGIITGFGPLCGCEHFRRRNPQLQENLIISASVGVGNPIVKELSKIMMSGVKFTL